MIVKDAVHISALFEKYAASLPDVAVTSIEYDSRKAIKGCCFVAVKGLAVDGHDFIDDAAKKGAALIVAERAPKPPQDGVAVVIVENTRMELARLSDAFYGHPSRELGVIGVTGTNGKTTVAYMLQKILNTAGYNTSRFGTVDYNFPDATLSAPNTTPESADLHKLFAKATRYENPRAVIEVSSHGLWLGRLERTRFKGVVLTNVTQDHLDFHPTMDEYIGVKKMLFTDFDYEYAVINRDDPVGENLLGQKLGGAVLSYGFSEKSDVRITEYLTGFNGGQALLKTPIGDVEMRINIPGGFNIQNAAASVAAGIAEGLDADVIRQGLSALESVPGRFEKVDRGQDFAVIVDYAHTDNALLNVLKAAGEMTKNRLICLFGCGGDRDKGKRKLMGKAADSVADLIVITSDNPRNEDPQSIIEDILEGIPQKSGHKVKVLPMRGEAIKYAVEIAQSGDTVVIAGKGHEDYQVIGSERIHFDDREMAAKALEEMR